ncbi:MAG TPA: phage holin family protein [Candidatus Nitrosocosmicus sp.]|nr:phage holin family protein [Candidatus Nitrosocosmicus sp.]
MKDTTLSLSGGLFGLIIAAAVASWQTIIVVAVIYSIALFGNLITGLLFAKQTNSYSEEKGKQAVYKKAGVITGIMVLFALDLMIMGMARSGGVTYDVPFLGCIFACYSAAHEFTSMLQNIKKLGNKVPTVIEEAARKAEEALDQGKLPDISNLINRDGGSV